MSASIVPFSATQAAELAEPESKREATALARCCLAGIPIRKIHMSDGLVVYATGLRRFAGIEQLEDFLDATGCIE